MENKVKRNINLKCILDKPLSKSEKKYKNIIEFIKNIVENLNIISPELSPCFYEYYWYIENDIVIGYNKTTNDLAISFKHIWNIIPYSDKYTEKIIENNLVPQLNVINSKGLYIHYTNKF